MYKIQIEGKHFKTTHETNDEKEARSFVKDIVTKSDLEHLNINITHEG